jgi:hypothetical protein
MAKQYHYVVCYDTETKQFSLDAETLDNRFDHGEVWNTVANEWESFQNTEELEADFIAIEDKLAGELNKLNKENN